MNILSFIELNENLISQIILITKTKKPVFSEHRWNHNVEVCLLIQRSALQFYLILKNRVLNSFQITRSLFFTFKTHLMKERLLFDGVYTLIFFYYFSSDIWEGPRRIWISESLQVYWIELSITWSSFGVAKYRNWSNQDGQPVFFEGTNL